MKMKIKMRCQNSSNQEVKLSTPSGHRRRWDGGFNPRRLRRGTAAHPFEAYSGTSRDALLEASRLAFSEGGLGLLISENLPKLLT